MAVGEGGLTIGQADGSTGGIDRVVFGKLLGPAATHLAPADGRGFHIHLCINEQGDGSTTTPRATQRVVAVDIVFTTVDDTVFIDPTGTSGLRRYGSIAALELEQFDTIEIGIALAAHIVGTAAHLSTLKVVWTGAVGGPGVLITPEAGVLIDGLGSLVVNGEVTAQCIGDAALDGDILKIIATARNLEHVTLPNTIVDRGITVRRICIDCILRNVVGDDGALAALTNQRDIATIDIGDGVGQRAFELDYLFVAALAIGMAVGLVDTTRQHIRTVLDEDAEAQAGVFTFHGSSKSLGNGAIVGHDEVVALLHHLRLSLRGEANGDIGGERLSILTADHGSRQGEGIG